MKERNSWIRGESVGCKNVWGGVYIQLTDFLCDWERSIGGFVTLHCLSQKQNLSYSRPMKSQTFIYL